MTDKEKIDSLERQVDELRYENKYYKEESGEWGI